MYLSCGLFKICWITLPATLENKNLRTKTRVIAQIRQKRLIHVKSVVEKYLCDNFAKLGEM